MWRSIAAKIGSGSHDCASDGGQPGDGRSGEAGHHGSASGLCFHLLSSFRRAESVRRNDGFGGDLGNWLLLGLAYLILSTAMKLSLPKTKSKGGRPRTDATPVMVRIVPQQLKALDGWRDKQDDAPTRPEAIRRLIEKALGGK
ncbi:MAG: hypothetical protein WA156_00580 [Methylocystis silviterrae]